MNLADIRNLSSPSTFVTLDQMNRSVVDLRSFL
jgi:hypothetical protein